MNNINPIAIKICGMRDHKNIMEIATLKPSYLGFIFYRKSPRFVGDDFVIPAKLSPAVKRVGVFVNEKNDAIVAKANSLGLDFIQLHGNETPDQCMELKDLNIGIIKAFQIDEDFKFNETRSFKKVVDYFLFDTKGKLYGGNATAFNWKLLEKYDQQVPFFLSGGLTPENVEQLGQVAGMNIHALDFNSGVEASPGLKSVEKVRATFENTEARKHPNT